MGYLIVNLYNHQRKLKLFIRRLEESIIRYLKEVHGIDAGVSEEHVGVWVGDEKIAAVGISISRGVTMHGFALNISCDLVPFGWIVPCGIRDRGVTSVAALSGTVPDMGQVRREYATRFAEVYGYTIDEERVWDYPGAAMP